MFFLIFFCSINSVSKGKNKYLTSKTMVNNCCEPDWSISWVAKSVKSLKENFEKF